MEDQNIMSHADAKRAHEGRIPPHTANPVIGHDVSPVDDLFDIDLSAWRSTSSDDQRTIHIMLDEEGTRRPTSSFSTSQPRETEARVEAAEGTHEPAASFQISLHRQN